MARHQPDADRNSDTTQELKSYVERLENLEKQKKDIVADIKDLKSEIKARGYEMKAVERIVKERAEDETERLRRREIEAITDIYRAALGMLDDTPLGEAARERLSKRPEAEPAQEDAGQGEEPATPQRAPLTAEDIASAKDAGRQACRDGKRVIDNPYTAGDPRRAAWDEGWCSEAGSDGMDIPSAWRRSEKKKPAKKSGEQPDAPKDGKPGEPPEDGEE